MQERVKSRWAFGHLTLVGIAFVLLSLPWLGATPLSLFFAFIPLLALAESCSAKRYLGWVSFTLTFWVILTQYWIYHATIAGPIASAVVQTILFSIPFIIYKISITRSTRALAYTLFVSSWIAIEFIYTHNNEVSHPWIILGNGFAENIKLIQWYEYTGVFGGSLWVLIVNILIFEYLRIKSRKRAVNVLLTIILPIIISQIIYHTYKESDNPVKISVIQPNIDPYLDKFDGMTQQKQNTIIRDLISQAPKDVTFVVTPETAVNDNIDIDSPTNSYSIRFFQDYMRKNYPETSLILGATMFKFYPHAKTPPTLTARHSGARYYDVINGSLIIDSVDTESYIKSKLVAGVESLPFPKILGNLKIGSIDLGGMSGALLTQPDREVFSHRISDIKVAAPICYESIYGEYMGDFVRNGADILFVITNDGWWRDTHGYKQHYSYARLRAVESRRAVARSANTGISGFISQRGDDIVTLGWDKRGILTETINANNKITFYTKYGDYIGRGAIYIFMVSLLYLVAYIFKKKSHLN